MTANDLTSQAVDALRVATVLHRQYMQDVRGLPTSTVVTMEQRLLALDENFRGVWEKLDQAADLLQRAGHDTGRYRAIRALVPETVQGYHERNEEQITLGGVQQSTTWSISQQRLTDLASALAALRQLLPGVQWEVAQDAEVEAFLARQRSPMRWLKPLLIVGLVAAGVGAIIGVMQLMRPPDYGPHARTIIKLEKHLELDPCHKQRMVKLAENLNRAGAHETVLERAGAFFRQCGEHRRLRWATLTAYKKMQRWDEAIAEATLLIKAVPHDRDYRYWRGEIHEAKGDTARAAADYRQTLALAPTLADVPVDLTELSAKQGRPCEALLWLGNLIQHHAHDAAPVVPRLQRMRTRCTKLAGKGRAFLPPVGSAAETGPDAGASPSPSVGNDPAAPPPDQGAPPAPRVTINGTAVRTFEVQRDALYTMISDRLAARLGLETGAAVRLILRTPDGFFPSRLMQVKKITAGGASADQVQVLVTPKPPRGVECVLGQSFLTRFHVTGPGDGAVLLVPFSEAPDSASP